MHNTILTDAKIMGFVPSEKPAEAKKFYTETLGLKLLSDDPFGSMYSVHGTLTLRIQKVRELQPQPFTTFGWQIDDIEAAVTSLAARGVKFEVYGFPSQDARGICTFDGGARVAWFKDPDGNTLSITQFSAQGNS